MECSTYFYRQQIIEDYVDLITSIEITAEKLQMPVRIEGYQPKTDYRVEKNDGNSRSWCN
jgi:uncharacterized protein (DUF2126 family)